MILLITVIIFIIGLLLCFNKEKLFKKMGVKILNKYHSYDDTVKGRFNDYIMGIITTVLGVTLAIVFTNYDVGIQEKSQTIDILNAVYTELEIKSGLMNTMGGMLEADESYMENVSDMLQTKPLSNMLPLDVLLTNAPYAYTISGYSYTALSNCKMNFYTLQNRMLDETEVEKMKKDLDILNIELECAFKVIDAELRYQNNEINEEQLIAEINYIMSN